MFEHHHRDPETGHAFFFESGGMCFNGSLTAWCWEICSSKFSRKCIVVSRGSASRRGSPGLMPEKDVGNPEDGGPIGGNGGR